MSQVITLTHETLEFNGKRSNPHQGDPFLTVSVERCSWDRIMTWGNLLQQQTCNVEPGFVSNTIYALLLTQCKICEALSTINWDR